jgi:hypothetical protein
MTENITTPSTDPNNGQPDNTQGNDPASSSAGQSPSTSTEAPSQDLPEKFRDKTASEIAQQYVQLEKKLGEQSTEVETARKLKSDMDQVLQVLWKNPKLYEQVERELLRSQDGGLPEIKSPKNEDDGEAENSGKDDDVRSKMVNDTISDFEQKFKISELPSEKRKILNKKIATEFAELRDPSGKKTVAQLIKETPVNQLGKLLEKAYWLAQKDQLVDQDTIPDVASISSMSASSGKADTSHGLSERELKVAQNLGVAPDEYAKNKKKLNS